MINVLENLLVTLLVAIGLGLFLLPILHLFGVGKLDLIPWVLSTVSWLFLYYSYDHYKANRV